MTSTILRLIGWGQRYWATLGLRVLGEAASQAKQDLRGLLEDEDASVRITAAAALANLGDKKKMSTLLVNEAKIAQDDAHALWALDTLKYLDVPTAIEGFSESDLVKGNCSGRSFDYLRKGGLVFGDGTDYWNP